MLCAQALRAAVRERPPLELEALLLAYAKPFQRLVMDNARCAGTLLGGSKQHAALGPKGVAH